MEAALGGGVVLIAWEERFCFVGHDELLTLESSKELQISGIVQTLVKNR